MSKRLWLGWLLVWAEIAALGILLFTFSIWYYVLMFPITFTAVKIAKWAGHRLESIDE